MSKTWKQPYSREASGTPQKAIDRIIKAEAQREIRDAVRVPQEATSGR